MIKITKLEASGKLYTLSIESEDGVETLKVHQDILVRHLLFSKKTLTENQLKTVKKENASAILVDKALTYLSHKDYSKAGLRNKLAPHGEKETVEDTIRSLEHIGYLNEDKALRHLIDAMWEYSLKGPKAIKDKALKEKFSESAIDALLSVYGEELLEKRLKRFIEKIRPRYDKYPKRKIKEKLLRLCITNGYDMDSTRSMIEQALTNVNHEEKENALLEKRIQKIKDAFDLNDFKSKGKLIQKLLREGFNYEAVKAKLK